MPEFLNIQGNLSVGRGAQLALAKYTIKETFFYFYLCKMHLPFISTLSPRYHVPFLRGPMDADIDKHEKIEELIAGDLDHWMCNLYFEIIRLPR